MYDFNLKNVYIDKIDYIKIKPIDVKLNTYINFDFENNDKAPKFEVGNHVRISKYKNNLQKSSTLVRKSLWSLSL